MRTVQDVCWRRDEITHYCLISIQLSSLALEVWALHSISLLELEYIKFWQVLMILPLSGTAVLDNDIQGFFFWSLTGHSLPLEPFLVTHLLHFLSTSYDYLDGYYRANKSSVSVISNHEFLWEIQIGYSIFCIFRWKCAQIWITIIIHRLTFSLWTRPF